MPTDFNSLKPDNPRDVELSAFTLEEIGQAYCNGKVDLFAPRANKKIILSSIAPDVTMADLKQLQIDATRIASKGAVVGQGAFGKVFKGKARCFSSDVILRELM